MKIIKKILRAVIITVCIVIIPVSMSIYKNSRREKYAGRNCRIAAVKKTAEETTTYEMYCSMPERKWGRVIKNNPENFYSEYIPKESNKLWKNLSEFDTYVLLDIAEKYIDEEYHVFPEAKVKAANNKCYVITYGKYNNYGAEKSTIKVAVNPREMGYIYQIIAFEYYFHKYFLTLIVGAILLAVILGVIAKRKDNKWKMTTSADLH